MRPIPVWLAIVALARAGDMQGADAGHAQCSVFSRHPCVPGVCSVFSRDPCVPQPLFPFGEGLQLTIVSGATEQKPDNPDATDGPKSARVLNTIAEVFAALEACWMPPALDRSRPGMQITVMVSFKRSGELLGKPRITYETPGATDDERLAYRVAMAQALERCLPLRFTEGLGNALAGRPMTLRFVDNRKLKQAGTGHDRES